MYLPIKQHQSRLKLSISESKLILFSKQELYFSGLQWLSSEQNVKFLGHVWRDLWKKSIPVLLKGWTSGKLIQLCFCVVIKLMMKLNYSWSKICFIIWVSHCTSNGCVSVVTVGLLFNTCCIGDSINFILQFISHLVNQLARHQFLKIACQVEKKNMLGAYSLLKVIESELQAYLSATKGRVVLTSSFNICFAIMK